MADFFKPVDDAEKLADDPVAIARGAILADYLAEQAPTGVCPICDGRTWIYYNGGRTACDGCGGDGRNHYAPRGGA